MKPRFLLILWMALAAFVVALFFFILGAWSTRYVLIIGGTRFPRYVGELIRVTTEIPPLVKSSFEDLYYNILDIPGPLLIEKDQLPTPIGQQIFPDPSDEGYLLLSAVTAEDRQSVVQLIRISDGKRLAKWVPDWKQIHAQIKGYRWAPKGSLVAYGAGHPLLLGNGDIVFNTGNALVRQPLCSRAPRWVINYPFHHSIEMSNSGTSVWVPSVTEQFSSASATLQRNLRDDSLAEVSLDGKVLRNISFSEILTKNGMVARLLGSSGFLLNPDPIHLNQIAEARSSGRFWNKGDLLISARHLSTVFLYRPSTGKILWSQQGPWLNQHSAEFFGENGIVVFGNDVYGAGIEDPFVYHKKRNSVYLYDFEKSLAQELYPDFMDSINPRTSTGGRATLNSDMSLFVEETNNSRLFKVDGRGLRWSYVNVYDEKHLGAVSWSRYLTRSDLEEVLKRDSLACNS